MLCTQAVTMFSGLAGNTAFTLLAPSEKKHACNARHLREAKLWSDSNLNKSLYDNYKSLI